MNRLEVAISSHYWYKLSGHEICDRENEPFNIMALSLSGHRLPDTTPTYTHELQTVLTSRGFDLSKSIKETFDIESRGMILTQYVDVNHRRTG